VSDRGDAVIHVTGGKWTTYRQMAQDAVDALSTYVEHLARVRTKSLALHGVSAWRPTGELETHLYHRFGSDSSTMLEMIRDDPSLGEPLIERQPYVGAEYLFSVRAEMATSLVDLLSRRTRAHLHDARSTLAAAPAIARLVASDMGWNEEEITAQVECYRALVEYEFSGAGLDLHR
jgi:glycerol-3-phosphate dehydrogenase